VVRAEFRKDRETKIIDYLNLYPDVSNRGIASIFGCSEATVRRIKNKFHWQKLVIIEDDECNDEEDMLDLTTDEEYIAWARMNGFM